MWQTVLQTIFVAEYKTTAEFSFQKKTVQGKQGIVSEINGVTVGFDVGHGNKLYRIYELIPISGI
jgi:hypothetical protein